jgi:hypothetical protein
MARIEECAAIHPQLCLAWDPALQLAERLDFGWRSAFSAAIQPFFFFEGFSP